MRGGSETGGGVDGSGILVTETFRDSLCFNFGPRREGDRGLVQHPPVTRVSGPFLRVVLWFRGIVDPQFQMAFRGCD